LRVLVGLACALAACGRPDPAPLATVGLVPTAIDFNEDPCKDFYRFACGAWISKTVLEPTESERSLARQPLYNRGTQHLENAIVEMDGSTPAGVFFRTCMDTGALTIAGANAIKPLFAIIDGVVDTPSLIAATAALRRYGIVAPFGILPARGEDVPRRWGLFVYPNGVGLNPATYLSTDSSAVSDVESYRQHVQTMLQLSEAANPSDGAARTISVEKAIAAAWPTGLLPAPVTMSVLELDSRAPGLRFGEYLAAIGVGVDAVEVVAPQTLTAISTELMSRPPEDWRAYLRMRVISSYAPFLSPRILQEVYGYLQRPQPPRRTWCLDGVEAMLWPLVARDFVGRYLPDGNRNSAQDLLAEIARTFDGDLAALTWLDEPTRAEARAKLAAIEALVGQPDVWPALGFEIDESAFGRTIVAATLASNVADLMRVGQPVDRREWPKLSPMVVNAFYVPNLNQVVLPGGILQPSYFSPGGNLAANLGKIGSTMGHEMTHGFDDGGSRFDADGLARDWWTPEVRSTFDARTACLAQQYSAYRPTARGNVNGNRTLGENIADLGGIKLAIRTLRAARKITGPRDGIGGFSEEQLVFLSYGQKFCAVESGEWEEYILTRDSHSPAQYRVNGALRNLPEFAQAFSCDPNATLNTADRCEVW
jgi:putative endopeptidase